MTVSVVLADDQSVVRAGLTTILAPHDDLTVVGEASDGHEALHAVLRLDPDVVLMDVRMPRLDGVAATGPYLECKEHIGGFWIIETPDDDAAMAWPDKATLACRGAVEMRPFQ